jgi:hypothetical protein
MKSIGALLWSQGGPALAGLAIPSWVLLSWTIWGGEMLAATSSERRRLG